MELRYVAASGDEFDVKVQIRTTAVHRSPMAVAHDDPDAIQYFGSMFAVPRAVGVSPKLEE